MSKNENRSLQLSYLLPFPIEQVWNAWTDPEQIEQWWGPVGFTTTIHKMIVAEGEEWLLTMFGPDGKRYPNKAIFREVIPYKKIAYEHFNPDFIATVVFEPTGKNTLLKWSSVFPTEELFNIIVKTFKADQGLRQNVEKLEAFLSR